MPSVPLSFIRCRNTSSTYLCRHKKDKALCLTLYQFFLLWDSWKTTLLSLRQPFPGCICVISSSSNRWETQTVYILGPLQNPDSKK